MDINGYMVSYWTRGRLVKYDRTRVKMGCLQIPSTLNFNQMDPAREGMMRPAGK
jgi:hypothetical protein